MWDFSARIPAKHRPHFVLSGCPLSFASSLACLPLPAQLRQTPSSLWLRWRLIWAISYPSFVEGCFTITPKLCSSQARSSWEKAYWGWRATSSASHGPCSFASYFLCPMCCQLRLPTWIMHRYGDPDSWRVLLAMTLDYRLSLSE